MSSHTQYSKVWFIKTLFRCRKFGNKNLQSFSVSAKRVEALKSCYDYTENEYQKLLKHIPIRWLSLFPAIDRLISNLEEVKAYFIGVGTDECSNIITEFVWDCDKPERKINFLELFLHFAHQFMRIFHDLILQLEKKMTNSTNLYDIIYDLKVKLEIRIEHRFYGSTVNKNLNYFSKEEKEIFEKSAINAYQRSIDYLKKPFDFENSIFKSLKTLNLEKNLIYEDLLKIVEKLNLEILIDEDKVFEECHIINRLMSEMTPK